MDRVSRPPARRGAMYGGGLTVQAAEAPRQKVRFTLFRNATGIVAKRLTLAPDGTLVKASAANMAEGTAETVTDTLEGLAGRLPALDQHEALGLGICDRAPVQIVTAAALAKHPEAVARTQEHFHFPAGPALLGVDSDTAANPDELVGALTAVLPSFADAEKLVVFSTSAGVYRVGEDKPVARSKGLHLYTTVLDGSDIPRFGKALCRRLWLAGFGHVEISKAGCLLVRQIIDAATFAPERIVFESAPVLGEGLERRPPAPVYVVGCPLDTSLCPDLTPGEEQEYERLVAEEKAKMEPEAQPIRDAWLLARGKAIAKARNIPYSEARSIAIKAAEGMELEGDFVLQFRDFGFVAAADIVKDADSLAKYDKAVLHDPLEPDYKSPWCAIFYANGGMDPKVYSQAHGGQIFKLPPAPVFLDKRAAAEAQGPEANAPDGLSLEYGAPFYMTKTKRGFVYAGLNEAYFAGLHGTQHCELYEPNERAFFRYSDESGLFAEVTADLLKQEISSLILDMGREKQVPGLMQDRDASRLAAVIAQLKGIAEQRDAFKKTGRVIHLANGFLDLSGDGPVLLPFSPDFRSRNQSPIAYHPEATCPRFMDELILPAVHPEDVSIIQKYLGLSLLGRNIIQRLLILDGLAGRGKTQLAIVFQHLVGMVNCTQLRTEHLNERFELFRFLRKTLLAGVDAQADFLSTKGAVVLKALVGGDIMDAEQKGGTGCFPIEGAFAVVITCNSRLRVRLEGDVGAWKRRLLIVRYEAPPPAKKIPDFGAHLVKTEGSGILNWAVDGLGALLNDVERIGDIALTPRQAGVVDSLLAESDSLRHFLNARVERIEGGDLTVHEIIESYAEYCPDHGWTPLPHTILQNQIEGLMLEMFRTAKVQSIKRDGKAARGFRNVRFRDESA